MKITDTPYDFYINHTPYPAFQDPCLQNSSLSRIMAM